VSGLRYRVFDPTNTTFLGELVTPSQGQFVDEYNGPGYGTVRVLLDSPDAALLLRDNVVRVQYENATRFAWIVEKLDRTLSDPSGQRLLTVAGRGLLAWLEDGVVFPQGGLRETSSEDRPFNFAAEDGPWKNSVTFAAPVGVRWRDDTTPRKGLPTNWPDADAQWIWSTDPNSETVPEGTVNYFRSTFTLTESTRIRFFATADNYFDMYLDGSLVMSSNRFSENAPSFSQQTAYTTRLGAGVHTIAARVRNGKPWERYSVRIDKDSDEIRARDHGLINGTIIRFSEISRTGTGLLTGTNYYVRQAEENSFKVSTSPPGSGSVVDILQDAEVDIRLFQDRYAGFLMTAYRINDDGRVDRSVRPIRRTNQVAWEVATEEPQFRPAMILRTLIEEAAARSVYRFNKFTYSFNTATPTTGAWSTYVDLFLRVGSDLLSVYDEMVDLGVDIWINPDTCQLSAAELRGTDRSATVRLEVANNLMAYATTAEPKFKTQALVQNTDGWQQVGTGVAQFGRREVFIEAGRTRSPSTARIIARQLLSELSKQRVTASTVEAIVVPGCVPYVNFDVGDVISIPAPTGSGFVSARVLSLSMTDEQGTARFMPELEVL
jgi:hypothetical protein